MAEKGEGKRRYSSELRDKRAAETRHHVLEAAAEEFATRGYAGATMARIAERAAVSVESVYAIGTKSDVLLEAFRLRYAGASGWRSILEQRVATDIFAITERDAGLEAVVEFLVAAHQRSAELWLVVRASAAVDPALEREAGELGRLRAESFRVTTDWMVRIGILAPVGTAQEHETLTAWLSVAMSSETYVQLTQDWGFSDEQYADWVRRTIPTLRP